MRILIIDNNRDPKSWGAADLRRFTQSLTGATTITRRAPHGDLPESPSAFDRIILSGSATSVMEDAPWISELMDFVKRAVNENKPLLGVCYGHQILNRALGGAERVARAKEAEFGWTKIEVLNESPLLEGVPKTFYSFSAHFDEVKSLAPGMKNLAKSQACSVQACQLGSSPIFGIQFHPEKNLKDAAQTFAERHKVGKPKNLLHEGESEKYYDPKIGEAVFGNFFKSL